MAPRSSNSKVAAKPFLSLVVPVYDEEDSIAGFFERVRPVLTSLGVSHEIVFVDDGSRDGTTAAIRRAAKRTDKIVLVSLSRNFGKESALTAGLDHASGQVVVPLDIDLQDPPELIGEFVEKWRQGYDVVYGTRRIRTSDPALKRLSSRLFYRAYNSITQVAIPAHVSDFCLLDRKVVSAIARLPERNRFMKGLISWPGFNSTTVEYERTPRLSGQSKFNYWRLWNFAIDGFTGFSTMPLRAWTYVGIATGALGTIYALWMIVKTVYFGIDIPGYASIMVAVLVLGGIQLISLGVVGEYVARIIAEVKQRPVYLVDRVDNLDGRRGGEPEKASKRETW